MILEGVVLLMRWEREQHFDSYISVCINAQKSFTDCDVLRKNVICKSSAWHA